MNWLETHLSFLYENSPLGKEKVIWFNEFWAFTKDTHGIVDGIFYLYRKAKPRFYLVIIMDNKGWKLRGGSNINTGSLSSSHDLPQYITKKIDYFHKIRRLL